MRQEPQRSRSALKLVPYYDATRGRLWYGERLVKEFRQPAAKQRALLAAFQHARWHVTIPNPFKNTSEKDRREQLHDAVHALNRHQRQGQVLRFHGDGSGTSVWWEAVAEE